MQVDSNLAHRHPSSRRPSTLAALAFCCAALWASSCFAPTTQGSTGASGQTAAPAGLYAPGLPVSHPPFVSFHASWKTRTDAHYVYVEHYGSYTECGACIPGLVRELEAQGLEDDGPPFVLFYDDPATTPIAQLRSRICAPIRGSRSPRAPLRYDLLPQANVAYAVVSGPYTDVARAYPQMNAYLERSNWELAGPILEMYVVPPIGRKPTDLMCEVQFPIATRR